MQKTIYKICNETYHIIRVINSCKTIEQLENANRWACSLLDRWYNLLEKFSLGSGVNVQRYIDSAVTDMTKAIAKQKKHIKSQQNEEVAANNSKTKQTHQIAAKQSKHSKSKN
jgi:hypothetical protein